MCDNKAECMEMVRQVLREESLAPKDEALKDLAWNYFNFHATQRLTTFNFYIAASAILMTGLFSLYKDGGGHPAAEFGISSLLSILSIIFLLLDMRNRQLIGFAEKALIDYETRSGLKDGDGFQDRAVFGKESEDSSVAQKKWPKNLDEFVDLTIKEEFAGLKECIRSRVVRYGFCFSSVFIFFGLAGVVGMINSF